MRRTGVASPPLPTDLALNTGEHDGDDDLEHALGVDYDIDPTKSSCDVAKSQAARALLLQCWDRAVHAAETTVDASPAPTATATQPPPPPTAQESRTRDDAVAACQRLRIEVPALRKSANVSDIIDDSSQVDDTLTKCFVCDVQFSSVEKLQQHFFGTPRMQGCCWILIDRRRRKLIASVLESEVRNQMQQLLRMILADSLIGSGDATSNSDTPLLDCFDVLRILENRLDASRVVVSSSMSKGEPVSETMEVHIDKPPIPINTTLLEAVRFRLADRYAKVPR